MSEDVLLVLKQVRISIPGKPVTTLDVSALLIYNLGRLDIIDLKPWTSRHYRFTPLDASAI